MIFFAPISEIVSISGKSILFIFGAITFLFWIIGFLSKKAIIRINKPTMVAIFFLLWNALSITWAQDQGIAITRIISLASMVLLLIIFQDLVKDNARLKIVFFTIFISLSMFSIYANISRIAEGTIISSFSRTAIIEQQNPNHVALILGLGLLATPIVLANIRRNVSRIIAFFCAANIAVAIIFSASRGAWASLIIAIIVGKLITKKKFPIKQVAYFAIIFLFIIAAMAYTGLTSYYLIDRATSILDISANKGGTGRLDIYLIGIEMIKNNFLIGVGAGNFPVRFQDYIDTTQPMYVKWQRGGLDSHSTFLAVQTETGIIGIILFAYLIISIFKKLFKYRKNLTGNIAITTLLFGVVFSTVLTSHWGPIFWIMISLSLTIVKISEEDQKTKK